jgi:hypothetical protein
VGDLAGRIDFSAALHLVHEIPDKAAFFGEVYHYLRPGGRLLVVEPKGHVSEEEFALTTALALKAGFEEESQTVQPGRRRAVLVKPETGP